VFSALLKRHPWLKHTQTLVLIATRALKHPSAAQANDVIAHRTYGLILALQSAYAVVCYGILVSTE
jgi:hypothetical protein